MLLNAITVTIVNSVSNSHTPNCFDSDFWTGFICILLSLVCVYSYFDTPFSGDQLVRSLNMSQSETCNLFSCVFPFHNTNMCQVFVSCFCFCICLNFYQCPWRSVSWCLCVSSSTYFCQVSSFSTRLIFVPAIVPLMCLACTALALCTCQYSADVHWLW